MKRFGTGSLLWAARKGIHCAPWWNEEPLVIYAGECQLTTTTRILLGSFGNVSAVLSEIEIVA